MNVVIRIDEDTKKEMIDYYKDKIKEVENKPPYVVFIAKEEEFVILAHQLAKFLNLFLDFLFFCFHNANN